MRFRPNPSHALLTATLFASAFALAQAVRTPPPPAAPPGSAPAPNTTAIPRAGDPLSGLGADQLAAFAAGREVFTMTETVDTGLGPIFNGVSCVQCHRAPAPGGGSPITVTRFGRFANGVFDPLAELGGSLLQRFATTPDLQEHIPREANVVARRISTPVFGAGLLEAIPDAAILDNARRPKPDGVAGRVAMVQDVATGQQRIGRFGWKAQHATLLSFAADAYANEMGITNRFFPDENAPNGLQALLDAHGSFTGPDDVVDPATGRSEVDAVADFMRLLAPPPRLAPSASAQSGERVFGEIGCAACHQPAMQTGPSTVPAFDRKIVAAYSDLLLHDMGALGDGIGQGAARPREMKTAPLWGLRLRSPLLHDGRAPSVDAAIRGHDGEGAAARDRYVRMPLDQQRQLLDFLNTL